MSKHERSFMFIKTDKFGNLPLPDEKLVKFIEQRLPEGLSIDTVEFFNWSREGAERHYAEHKGKGFYEELIHMITNGKCLGFIISGDDAVQKVRAWAGSKANYVGDASNINVMDYYRNNKIDPNIVIPERESLRFQLPVAQAGEECGFKYSNNVKVECAIWDKSDGEVIAAVNFGGKQGTNVTFSKSYNLVHSSDSVISAEREIANFENELVLQKTK